MRRAAWNETWMGVADLIARRSACRRDQVGAVIVSATNRIVASGYNGAPARSPGGDDFCLMCPRQQLGPPSPCISVHAEANAIAFCDRREREGGTLYVTSTVCAGCAPQVANSGIVRVVGRWDAFAHAHRDPAFTLGLFEACGIEVVTWT